MPSPQALATELDALATLGLRRQRRTVHSMAGIEQEVTFHGQPHPGPRPVISFCTNDYLGLADHPALIAAAQAGAARWGVGGTSSHMVSGHFAAHDAAEAALAGLVTRQHPEMHGLLFSTGYMANIGVLPALAGRGDVIFADKLNHASLVDGALLSRADVVRYPHNHTEYLQQRLAQAYADKPGQTRVIVTDSVFSMDGDLAPLAELARLACQYDAWLVIDDAHGLGVIGEQGRGCLDACGLLAMPELLPRLVYIGTLGKAAGVAGAFAVGTATTIEWLIHKARSAIFTTASPPLLAEVIQVSVGLMQQSDERRANLRARIAQLREGVSGLPGLTLMPSSTAIQPVVVGDNHACIALAQYLLERGLWVPAIRPPTVPQGSARLRISLSAAHTEAQIAQLVDALHTYCS